MAVLWREFEDESDAVNRLLSRGATGREEGAEQRLEQGRLRNSDEPESERGLRAGRRLAGHPMSPIDDLDHCLASTADRRPRTGQWQLRLYVAGQSPKSLKAYANLVALCEEQLDARYEIEIVDLVKHPQLAAGDEIVAIPTLVRRLPSPMRKIIGDLSDTDRVLVGLQLKPSAADDADEQRLTRAQFEQRARRRSRTGAYGLTLFVSGASDSSAQAITNVRAICDAHLSGRYHLDIVDLNQEPVLAEQHHVLATPTLVKDHPLPMRMLVGDMSDHPRVLVALDVRAAVGCRCRRRRRG